jgi:branched-chain amino acid transport system permease protein
VAQLWVSTVELTCFFSLLGLAYLLVMEGSGLFNFAIGQYAMVGGLGTAWLMFDKELSIVPAALIGIVFAVACAGVTEVAVVRPIQRRTGGDELPALVAVVALLAALEQFAGWRFGQQTLPGRPLVAFDGFEIAGAQVAPHVVILVIATVLVVLLTTLWRRYTSTGRLLRAVGDNEHAAALLGLPVKRIRITAFVVAGAVAGLAGILFAPKAGVSFHSGLGWSLLGFLVLVVGGTGSMLAPVLGGFLLAIVEIWAPYHFGSASKDYLVFAVALAFFAFRPTGVFARKVRA